MFARKKMSENIAPPGLEGGHVDGPVKALQGKIKRVGQVKRSALGDIANSEKEKINASDVKKKIPVPIIKPKPTTKTTTITTAAKPTAKPTAAKATAKPAAAAKKKVTKKDIDKEQLPGPQRKTRALEVSKVSNSNVSKQVLEVDDHSSIELDCSVLLDRVEEDISVIEEDDLLSFDSENYTDVFHVGIYAQDIFTYYKNREKLFHIPSYMTGREHPINATVRAILVDWMVEIQENFELNHETLYLGVKLTDLYLSRTTITKDSLQLLGAVALFVASKFDEQRYPLIEDFTYVCDNAFNSQQFLEMEIDLLQRIDFDLGIPISYRFLRRYAKVARLSIETLTLARFILEMSLMEAEFIGERDSKIAAAALYLAMRMRKESSWSGDLPKASGYVMADFKAILIGLNTMLLAPNYPQLTTIRCKYSHSVFHEVAKIPTMKTEKLL